jgi:hypothetical protein
MTDVAASFLFSEALSHKPEVRVVNLAESDEKKAAIVRAYERVLETASIQFDFEGAIEWATELAALQPQNRDSAG